MVTIIIMKAPLQLHKDAGGGAARQQVRLISFDFHHYFWLRNRREGIQVILIGSAEELKGRDPSEINRLCWGIEGRGQVKLIGSAENLKEGPGVSKKRIKMNEHCN